MNKTNDKMNEKNQTADRWTSENLTRTEKSLLMYVETRIVDHDGLLGDQHLNTEDRIALHSLQYEADFLRSGRVPSEYLAQASRFGKCSTWAHLTEKGWEAVHRLRRERAAKKGRTGSAIFEAVKDKLV